MTGGQHADGSIDPAAVTRLLHAEGVVRTVVVTDEPGKYPRGVKWAPGVRVVHRDRLDEVQRELRAVPGVTVILYDQECAAEKRRKRKRGKAPDPVIRVHINEAVCEGCGDCGKKSNCLSVEPVETEFGRKTQIDQTSCNKDYSCLLGDCPSFMLVTPGKTTRRSLASVPPVGEPVLPTSADLVMVGIGGTGVVTVNQVLATAALLSGMDARALDQTGLSQKAGAVVSHLRITEKPTGHPGLVPSGAATGYLVFDALAATSPVNLGRCSPSRTHAVVSTSEVPTGRMIVDTAAVYPGREELLSAISGRTASLRAFDALDLAERLFGTTVAANFLIVGAAYQSGLLPLTSAAIEEAIRLNGTGVEMSIAAFHAGRAAVADPSWLAGAPVATAAVSSPLPLDEFSGELRRLLEVRVPDLVGYQNAAYASEYLSVVRSVASVDVEIAEAVARSLHKLMAYKDEYEVARLHLAESVESTFGSGAQVAFALHPPLLRAFGLRRKITLRRTAVPAFRVLRALRPVRGKWYDPFGYAGLRRTERALIGEYVSMIRSVLPLVTPSTRGTVLALAAAPLEIRGYEHIKEAAVARYRETVTTLLTTLDAAPQPTTAAR
ncbi:DUF6537 domain-containing protein [Actinokineospora soli]|uniref:DUF6537 domain-containing protein n=1 Tax=Actinokineospora soli TaxID=1048753 RepID=A0ABW2TXS2_9PSEU